MRNIFKLNYLIIFSTLTFLAVQDSYAQQADTQKVAKQALKKKVYSSLRDSLRAKQLQRSAMIRSFKHSDGAVNDLLDKIDDYTTEYADKSAALDNGFDTLDISQRLPTLEHRMGLMKTTINKSNTMGYLVTIRDMIDHLKKQTKSWQLQLSTYSNDLDTTRQAISDFKNDTTFKTIPKDSTLSVKTALQIQLVEQKWQKLDSISQKAIIRIGLLENRVSALSILLIDLDNNIDFRIHEFTLNALDNEYGFIWDMHKNSSARADTAIVNTYTLNTKLAKYFFISKNNYYGHMACILLLIGFFTWIYTSKLKLARVKDDHQSIFDQTLYIVKHPYLTTLAVFSLLAPYFYNHPVAIFTQTMLVIMMAAIGRLIKSAWPKALFSLWKTLMVLLVLFSLSSLMILTTNTERITLLVLSAIAIYASLQFLKSLKKSPEDYPPFIGIALKIFIFINAASILLNIAGRFSLAKIAASMSIFNLCLAMGLYILVQVLMEGLFLQLEANKKTGSVNAVSFIDFKILQKKFKSVLINVTAILWLVALAKNLILDDYLYDTIGDFLNDEHKFNSTGFTLRSVLVFVVVIWLSGLIARIISYFYDFRAQQVKLTPQAKKTRSSILLIRLTVFVIGFFVAVNAAGIKMSEVTLIIGALGVGIGFGLQNIINNLVSGVILAFEKPVQVGDVIEVSGKSGTIKEIGIRSSKIACGDGSELIVPNGDLISQHVINWTLSDNNRRVELIIRVEYGTDLAKVEKILKKIINNHADIMQTPAPSVFVHNFSESSIDFRIWFWAADISTWLKLKSNVLSLIYTEFAKEEIEIPYSKGDLSVTFPEGKNPFIENTEEEVKNKPKAVKKAVKPATKNPPPQAQ